MPSRTRSGRLLLVALIAVLAAAAGCGDDDDAEGTSDVGDSSDEETTIEPGHEEECGLFERIEDLDDESQAIVNDTLGQALAEQDPAAAEAAVDGFLDAYRPFAAEHLPEMTAAYSELASLVPDELQTDVELVRDFTDDTLRRLASTETLDEVKALFESIGQEATAAAAATLRVDAHSRSTCGITIAD